LLNRLDSSWFCTVYEVIVQTDFMKNIFPLICCLFLLASCKKEVDELPAPSDTGANTFGLKLNGEFWVPQKFGIVPTASILEARFSGTGGLFINARNFSSSPTETEFEIYLKDVSGPGTYPLNQPTQNYPNQQASYAYYIKRRFMPLNEWITSDRFTGSVTITKFDKVAHIVSGSFEFTAGSVDGTADPITVTEGRFDVQLQ
jgi:hypothetical protein